MLSRLMARSLMQIVPERKAAVVTLNPDHVTLEETVNISGAWIKHYTSGYVTASGARIEGAGTIINIPDHQLNPAGNGREIRQDDRIVFLGQTYVVASAGADLTSHRTRWECVVSKIMPSV